MSVSPISLPHREMSVSESGEVFRVVPSGLDAEEEALPPFPLTSLLAVISELFVWRCRDQMTRLFESETPRLLRAALLRADLAAVVSSFGRSYFRSAVEADTRPATADSGGGDGGGAGGGGDGGGGGGGSGDQG